jgi:predicted RNA-binding protein with PUA-like domain
MARRYWLMKSEPSTYSIDDLEKDGSTYWDGVRNYRARNFMRDDMKKGDLVLFYHSNADPPGVAGIARVSRECHPDPTQFDKRSKYFDPKSEKAKPRWFLVDVEFVEKFADLVSLPEIKDDDALDGMMVRQRGARLSIQPVDKEHFDRIRKVGKRKR